jgi:hypothetical protein
MNIVLGEYIKKHGKMRKDGWVKYLKYKDITVGCNIVGEVFCDTSKCKSVETTLQLSGLFDDVTGDCRLYQNDYKDKMWQSILDGTKIGLSRHGKKIAKQIEEMCMIAKKEFEL